MIKFTGCKLSSSVLIRNITMNKYTSTNNRLKLFVIICISVALSSCATNKKIAYFQDIQTVNQAAATPALGGSTNNSLSTQNTGFLVDKNGDVEMALVGKIRVAGLTTFQAKELIKEKVAVFYQHPNVQLRFTNFKVSVLGEVNAPSTYTLPNERVTILDALSLAGDLTIYGKRENILIVRDNDGKKEFARLDLNSSEIFNSPYYYLRQNDVIYVEPNKARVSANNAAQIQILGIVTSVVSALILVVTAFR